MFELDVRVLRRDDLNLIDPERDDQEAEQDHRPDHDRLAPTVATESHWTMSAPNGYKSLRPASQSQ
ncbi:hypothetical protein GCM10009060_00110 [Halorubrum trapanicum]